MFTWILIFIIVAALFGVIDFDKIRGQLLDLWHKYMPEAQKYISQAKSKLSAKNDEKKQSAKNSK